MATFSLCLCQRKKESEILSWSFSLCNLRYFDRFLRSSRCGRLYVSAFRDAEFVFTWRRIFFWSGFYLAIVHVYRGTSFMILPILTIITKFFISSFSSTHPMKYLPHEREVCRDCFGAPKWWGSGIMQHIKECNFDRIDLISNPVSLKQRTWPSSEFNSVLIYTCINPRK